MPEGPSIVILTEAVQEFTGQTVIAAGGNTKEDISILDSKRIISFKSWGKHFLICFDHFTIRIHLMLFGTYRINEQKPSPARLSLKFGSGEINFYACSVKFLTDDINKIYDWTADVMNDRWSPRKALSKLRKIPDAEICDALLEQEIFSGVGNIIKNEVLFRVRVHPESKINAIPATKLREIVRQARIYSFEFLDWKKAFTLKKHWLAHAKRNCANCGRPLTKTVTGRKKRRSFYCLNCQKAYL